MGDFFQRPVAKRTRARRDRFWTCDESNRVGSSQYNSPTGDSVQGGSSERGRSANRNHRGRVVRETTSESESSSVGEDTGSEDDIIELGPASGGDDTGSDDDIIELGETTLGLEKKDDDSGPDVVELDTRMDDLSDRESEFVKKDKPNCNNDQRVERNGGYSDVGGSSSVKNNKGKIVAANLSDRESEFVKKNSSNCPRVERNGEYFDVVGSSRVEKSKGKFVAVSLSSSSDNEPSVQEIVEEENGVGGNAVEESPEDDSSEVLKQVQKRGPKPVKKSTKVQRCCAVEFTTSSSDEEDGDDTEDEDWVVESSDESIKRNKKARVQAQASNKFVVSASSSEDDDDEDTESSEEHSDKIAEKNIKRTSVSGDSDAHTAKILVNLSGMPFRRNGIATRTRSQFRPVFYSSPKRRRDSPCPAPPLDDTEEDGENKDDDDSSDSDACIGEANEKIEDGVEEVAEEKGGDLEEPSLFKIFVNKIWEIGGKCQEEEKAPKAVVVKTLPLKFNYGVEKPKPVEKSENDLLLDEMWAQMDVLLKSDEGKPIEPPKVVTEEPKETTQQIRETDQKSLCKKGIHDYWIDEQVGIICRSCRIIKTEIKYISPRVEKLFYDRPTKRINEKDGEYSMWERFDIEEDSEHSQGSYGLAEGTVWDMFPRLKENLYPHQQEGFEFLWKNIAGGMDITELKKTSHSNSIGGCVISHAPGTGKTLLTIVFLQSYLEVFKDCRAVIMAPCSMLLTWEAEFKKWKSKIPFYNLNSLELCGKEDKMALQLLSGKSHMTKWNRIVKILSWSKGNSVLGISYTLFEKLAGTRFMDDKGKKKPPKVSRTQEDEELSRILLEKPSLLVLDEGHTPRNTRSLIWKALEMTKTEKRIILSGTPFQNNFEELYNTLSLVRPKFLDSISSSKTQKTSNTHEKKDARGKWALLTNSIGKDGDDELLEKIKGMMAPFVHVHKGSILKDNLPGLRDCIVLLDPPPLQMKLLQEVQKIQNPFELEHAVCLVSIHPSLLLHCGSSPSKKGRPRKEKGLGGMKSEEFDVDEFKSKVCKEGEITSKGYKLDTCQGVKTKFLMELLRLSEARNEKVLVFCQYMHPFFLIKDQLNHHFKWTEGKEMLQMDGKDNMKHRQSMINLFNDPDSKVRVLLASTRACREGISLIGASRIVLLDVVWNPSVERQAISRAYRLGQKKLVYTYHLITSGTMEGEKYRKQVSKDRLSELVFTSTGGHDEKKNISSTITDDAIMEEMINDVKIKDMFREIIYHPKESDMVDTYF